jgi:hypothetical protein
VTPRRFYFQIRSANVIECVWARTLAEARLETFHSWLPFWDEIEWINPEEPTTAHQ